jgi:hypothetical protein
MTVLVDLAGLHEQASGTAEIAAHLTRLLGAPHFEVEATGRDVRLTGTPFRDA